jgi:hypothetical protein
MTTLIMQATPFVEMVAPKVQAMYLQLLNALDAFAEAKMRSAVPMGHLHMIQREIIHLPPTDVDSSLSAKHSRPATGLTT